VQLNRGEVWWANLSDAAGSGPGYRRPVLVVQGDAFNRSRLATAIVVVLTSNLHLVEAPGNVLVPARTSSLPRDSVANVSQVLTIDRELLTERAGHLPASLLRQVDDGLRTVLELCTC
jgi:mRNA interferase MazF